MPSPLFYIVNTVLTLCLYAVIVRVWMQYTRVNFYNPFTQFIIKCTQPIVGPLRKVLPSIGKIDTATFLLVYLLALLKFILLISNNSTTFSLFSPIYLFYAFLVIIYSVGYLIFWILIIRAILSWISRAYSPLEELLSQLTEPLIRPIRKIIPPIGNIDVSFMVFMFILMILNTLAMSLFGNWWYIASA